MATKPNPRRYAWGTFNPSWIKPAGPTWYAQNANGKGYTPFATNQYAGSKAWGNNFAAPPPSGGAAPPPPTAPPGGGQGGPMSPEDIYNMAVNSPYYQQALAASTAMSAANAANRAASIQGMLTSFGLVPAGFKDKYGDVTDVIRNLAAQNTKSGISTYARMGQALKDSNTSLSRNLAARGLRRSGARGYGLRKNQLGYDQNYSDAINKLLAAANNTYLGYAQGEYSNQMNLAAALQAAIGAMSNYNNGNAALPYQGPAWTSGPDMVGYTGPYGTVSQAMYDYWNTANQKAQDLIP